MRSADERLGLASSKLEEEMTSMGEERGDEEREYQDNCARKRVWTPEEDEKLKSAVTSHGERAWSRIADELPGRVGKQCRDRWCNHLSPELDKKKWSADDDEKLFEAVERLGNQWAEISRTVLPGRSDLSIKNRYYSRMRRENRKAEMSMLSSVDQSLDRKPGNGTKRHKQHNSKSANGPRVAQSDGDSSPSSDTSPLGMCMLPGQGVMNIPYDIYGKMGPGIGSQPPPPPPPPHSQSQPQSQSQSPQQQPQDDFIGMSGIFPQTQAPFWGFPGYTASMMFHSPFSPIASLSTTPIPSPPRSPMSNPSSNPANTQLRNPKPVETSSRSGSPSFALPVQVLNGGSSVGGFSWLPAAGLDAGLGSEGNGSINPSNNGPLSKPDHASAVSQGNSVGYGGVDANPEMVLSQFSSMVYPMMQGPSSPSATPPPSHNPTQGSLAHSGWFPTIGSKGLEYRPHFRARYGNMDSSVPSDHLNGLPEFESSDSFSQMNTKKPNKGKQKAKSTDGGNTGRWTTEEHQRFEEGLKLFGTQDWSKVTDHVKTRTIVQVRSHAQKYFAKQGKTSISDNGSTKREEVQQEKGGFAASTKAEELLMSDELGARSEASDKDGSVCSTAREDSVVVQNGADNEDKSMLDEQSHHLEDTDTKSCHVDIHCESNPSRVMVQAHDTEAFDELTHGESESVGSRKAPGNGSQTMVEAD